MGTISTSPAASGIVTDSSTGRTCRESALLEWLYYHEGNLQHAGQGAPPPARLRRAVAPTASSPLSWCVGRICLAGFVRRMEEAPSPRCRSTTPAQEERGGAGPSRPRVGRRIGRSSHRTACRRRSTEPGSALRPYTARTCSEGQPWSLRGASPSGAATATHACRRALGSGVWARRWAAVAQQPPPPTKCGRALTCATMNSYVVIPRLMRPTWKMISCSTASHAPRESRQLAPLRMAYARGDSSP